MKKYLIIIICLALCVCGIWIFKSKVEFSQKVKLGEITYKFDGFDKSGFVIKGCASNKGDYNSAGDCYTKGVAQYRNGNTLMYVYYDYFKDGFRCHLGDEKVASAIFFKTMAKFNFDKGRNRSDIYAVGTNKRIDLFVIENINSSYEGSPIVDFYIIGRDENGRYINYFDEHDLDGMIRKYKKIDKNGLSVFYRNLIVNSDHILVDYEVELKESKLKGQYRFDWNDKESKFNVTIN